MYTYYKLSITDQLKLLGTAIICSIIGSLIVHGILFKFMHS